MSGQNESSTMKLVNISHAWKYEIQNAWNWKLRSLKITLQLITIKIKAM
jgi:hypothetical protein